MTNKLEQDKKIIADAPEGATHFDGGVWAQSTGKQPLEKWNDMDWDYEDAYEMDNIRSLDDIRENIALQERIAELEREKQVLIKQHDMWEQQWHELNNSLEKRDLQSKIEAINHIISHDSAKCRSKRSLDCNAIHLADLYNYAIYLEQQLRQQAKGGDS